MVVLLFYPISSRIIDSSGCVIEKFSINRFRWIKLIHLFKQVLPRLKRQSLSHAVKNFFCRKVFKLFDIPGEVTILKNGNLFK